MELDNATVTPTETPARVHHSALVVSDLDASLRFWRDGMGFREMMDMEFDGDWATLFDVPAQRLRSIFLGDPARADGGIVELVQFVTGAHADTVPLDVAVGRGPIAPGFFLVSCYVDVGAVLERLGGLGLGGTPRRITVGPDDNVQMATVLDPDGVLVELVGIPGP
jgi:catechol 2,3-dioxygenase-like lactoylglutathione lyase family enzyme